MRFFLPVAVALFAAPMIVAGPTTSDTCESYTLKCSTSKTAWAGEKTQVKAALYNKAKGSTEDVSMGLSFNTDDLSYRKSKFSVKGYTAQTDAGELYYEGVTMKKAAKVEAVLDVDKCAATTTTVAAWADIGDCNLKVDCPVVSLIISSEVAVESVWSFLASQMFYIASLTLLCDDSSNIAQIDVKYKKHHTCNPTAAPTPAPTPSPSSPAFQVSPYLYL